MTDIIPSINHRESDEIVKRIRLVEPYVQWVHVDVSDGIFTQEKLFNEPEALLGFSTPVNIELHLMVDKPERVIDAWLKTGARRFLIHVESTEDYCGVWERISAAGKETGLALRPETSIEAYAPHAEWVKYVLVLGVNPGPSGQSMQPHIPDKVMRLRKRFPGSIIEVDGGVSLALGTAKKCVDAGAGALCAGYDIFSGGDVKKTIEQYRRL